MTEHDNYQLDTIKQKTKIKRIVKSIELQGSSKSLERERSFIEITLTKAGVSVDLLPLIVMACDEACANVVRHFYKNDPEKKYIRNRGSTNLNSSLCTEKAFHISLLTFIGMILMCFPVK